MGWHKAFLLDAVFLPLCQSLYTSSTWPSSVSLRTSINGPELPLANVGLQDPMLGQPFVCLHPEVQETGVVDADRPKQNQGILLKTVRIDVRPVKENFASPYLGVFLQEL